MGKLRLAVLLALVAQAGCGEEAGSSDCTEIGCLPATAQVQLSGLPSTPAVVELCADDECRTVRGTFEVTEIAPSFDEFEAAFASEAVAA